MKIVATLFLLGFLAGNSSAQELFINSEPASNMPRNSFGLRIGSESFSQASALKSRTDLELMYEENANLMTTAMLHASNYYGSYQYNNFGLYAKYRIYTDDGFKQHFRVAAYAEAAFGPQRNTFADIMLDGGNSGLNAGLIFTLLENHLALSSTLGAIMLVPNEAVYTDIKNYLFSLSAGYLIYPSLYESYHDLNINFYAELLGKYITYDKPGVVNYTPIAGENPDPPTVHERNIVLDLAIGPQVIINSISRIDLSVRMRLISEVESFPTPAVLIRFEQMFYH